MTEAFLKAFDELIGHEGGYVNHPRDPGRETNFGITKRSYPDLDIRGLTIEQARATYFRDFWLRVRGDDLPYFVAFNLFDGAVNSGVGQAVRWMQRAADVADDGAIGPITLGAWTRPEPAALVARYNGARLAFFTMRSTWDAFGRGWARRVAANLAATPLVTPIVTPRDGAPGRPPARLPELAWLDAAPPRAALLAVATFLATAPESPT